MLAQLGIGGVLVVIAVAGALAWAAWRWRSGTRELRQRLEAARQPMVPQRVDFAGLATLPEPVQRYFRAVLRDGQPMVAAVDMEHSGRFNLGDAQPRWAAFSSTQRVVTRRPGFDWDARITLLPGIKVWVHDAYVAGEGILHASLAGLVTLAELRGGSGSAIAEGELMRFLAEAAWYPTALLPGQGVQWEAVDAHSARATLAEGRLRVSLLFGFDQNGLIGSARAEARGRRVGGEVVPTPWAGRFWNYADRGGMRVPLDGEVAWLLPDGPLPYWRGHLARIVHEAAR